MPVEPMATYLAFMAIGQFDVRSYEAGRYQLLGRASIPTLLAGSPSGDRAGRRQSVPVLADGRPAYKR